MAGVTSNNYGPFTHLAGTIAEVLAELAAQQIDARRVVWYSDDGTNAKAVYYK